MDLDRIRRALGAKYDPDDTGEAFVVEGVPYTLYVQRNASADGLSFTAIHEPTGVRVFCRFEVENDDPEAWRGLLLEDLKTQHDVMLRWAALVKR
jgi:hypothetical protein